MQTSGGGGHRGGGVTPVPRPLNDSPIGMSFTGHTFTPVKRAARQFLAPSQRGTSSTLSPGRCYHPQRHPHLWHRHPRTRALCGSAWSGHCTQMESCTMWSSVTVSFHSTKCLQGSATSWPVGAAFVSGSTTFVYPFISCGHYYGCSHSGAFMNNDDMKVASFCGDMFSFSWVNI